MQADPNQQSGATLPALRKLAIWHPESGVIFSPYTRMLPSTVTWDPKSKHQEHLLYPRILQDQDIYLAFYPRKNWDSGALFSTFAPPNLVALIVEAPGSTPQAPRFILSDDVCQAWTEMENFLLDISDYLFTEYSERQYLPDIHFPTWPNRCGYREAHNSKAETFTCLRNTLHAFRLLSAFVSFTLSLWITEYESNCFDRPFQRLMNRPVDPIPPIYLDHLRDSVVCRILPGLRPGGFLNLYYTKWGRVMFRFCRFCVPFWMIWGHEKMYKTITPFDSSISQFLPEAWIIEKLKERQATFSLLVLPDAKGFGPVQSQTDLSSPSNNGIDCPLPKYAIMDNTDALPNSGEGWEMSGNTDTVDRSLIVDTYRSAQRPKETWESFRVRMEEGLERHKAVESEKDRQSREALEDSARQNGYSKKTTVFIWEEDEVNREFYRRTKVDRADVPKDWSYCTEHQRIYWSHRNEWDLVPHLPRYPTGHRPETPVEDLEIDDDRFNFLYSQTPPQKDDGFKSKSLPLARVVIQDDEANAPSTGLYVFPFRPVVEYLKFRHGFSTSLIDNWHPELHNPQLPKKAHLQSDNSKFALRRLGYGEKSTGQIPFLQEERRSLVNFHNICIAIKSKQTRCSSLPSCWDLGSGGWLQPGLERLLVQTVKNERQDTTNLYVIRPVSSSFDPSSWYVATTSATAVLLVFRRQWLTMREIAMAFLDVGIPFHTVEERMKEDSPVPPYRYRLRGLDARPNGFKPTESDYLAYVEARNEVFNSPRARVLRLRGGIVGRLALEAVPDVTVLEGPSFCDDIIGSTDSTVFVDDSISDNDLEIVSGVYRVSTVVGSKTDFSHPSWWPKHSAWERAGHSTDQWSPNAESFYVERIQLFQEKEWNLKGSGSWKDTLKYDRAYMDHLFGGSEALAAEFVQRHF